MKKNSGKVRKRGDYEPIRRGSEAFAEIAKAGEIPEEEWRWLEQELDSFGRIILADANYRDESRTVKQMRDELADTKRALGHLLALRWTDWQARLLFLPEALDFEKKSSRERYDYWSAAELRHVELRCELEEIYRRAETTLEALDRMKENGSLEGIFAALYKPRAPNAQPQVAAFGVAVLEYWRHGLKREIEVGARDDSLKSFVTAVFRHVLNIEDDYAPDTLDKRLNDWKKSVSERRPLKFSVRDKVKTLPPKPTPEDFMRLFAVVGLGSDDGTV